MFDWLDNLFDSDEEVPQQKVKVPSPIAEDNKSSGVAIPPATQYSDDMPLPSNEDEAQQRADKEWADADKMKEGLINQIAARKAKELPQTGFSKIANAAGAFSEGVLQGASFGYIDEILGIGDKDTKEGLRVYQDRMEKENPVAYGGGEMVGAFTSGVPTMGIGGFTGAANVAKMAGIGAIEGGVYAGGKTAAPLGSKDYVKDVATGVALGAAIPVGMKGVALGAKGVKKAVTTLIPQAARLKVFAGLSKEQAKVYSEYLEDINKFDDDKQGIVKAIERMKNVKSDIDVLGKQAAIFYDMGKYESVPNAPDTFLNAFRRKLDREDISVNAIMDNQAVKLYARVVTTLDSPNVTGRAIHNLRREVDSLVKWDRKNSLSPEEEKVMKALRNTLKEISSPSIKAGDAIFKVGLPLRQIRNKLTDETGKPKGFLNRLEEGKLNDSEVAWVNDNFLAVGKNLKEAIPELKTVYKDAPEEMNFVLSLEKVANDLSKRDADLKGVIEKAYKFIEFQRTGSLRNISNLVKVGAASTYGSPAIGALVAAVDVPSSVLTQLSQANKFKSYASGLPTKAINKVEEVVGDKVVKSKQLTKLKEAQAKINELRTLNAEKAKVSKDIREDLVRGNPSSENVRKGVEVDRKIISKNQELDKLGAKGETINKRSAEARKVLGKEGKDYKEGMAGIKNRADQFKDVANVVKPQPKIYSKLYSKEIQENTPTIDWDSLPDAPSEEINWDSLPEAQSKEIQPEAPTNKGVDSKAKYFDVRRQIEPSVTEEELENEYKMFSNKGKIKTVEDANKAFGVK